MEYPVAATTEACAHQRVNALIIVNAHGGNAVLANVAQKADVHGPLRVGLYPSREDLAEARTAARITSSNHDDMHAGELETSILLAAYPDYVRDRRYTTDQSAHLFDLARAANAAPRTRRRSSAAGVRPSVQRVLDAMSGAPAWVHNDRLDFLAANRLGYALYSEFSTDPIRPANSARFMFLNPRSRDFYPDWEQIADNTVATLRGAAGRNLFDDKLTKLMVNYLPVARISAPMGRTQRASASHGCEASAPP